MEILFYVHCYRILSAVAGQNVFLFLGGGGGATWPNETYGGPGENTLKIFEIFVPEIVAYCIQF